MITTINYTSTIIAQYKKLITPPVSGFDAKEVIKAAKEISRRTGKMRALENNVLCGTIKAIADQLKKLTEDYSKSKVSSAASTAEYARKMRLMLYDMVNAERLYRDHIIHACSTVEVKL
jgi:hypothetical protein